MVLASPVALASPGNTIAGFVRAAEVSDAQWGPPTAINLPSFRSTVGDMAKALAVRVGLSIVLFLCILVAWQLGYIQPTGLPATR